MLARFIIKLFGATLLAIGIIILVVDATRSLGASTMVFTTVEQTLYLMTNVQKSQLEQWISQRFYFYLYDWVLVYFIQIPTSLLCMFVGASLLSIKNNKHKKHF